MTTTATYIIPPGRAELALRPGAVVDLRDSAGANADKMLRLTVKHVLPGGGRRATVWGVDDRGVERTVFVSAPAGPVSA